MPEDAEIPSGWEYRGRPAYLFRRFQFSGYRETRVFLDRLAALSEEIGYYPDISFGTTYANVTVHARDGEAIGSEDITFARRVSELAQLGKTDG
ncbi:4a-hydroxytetrahydrobiopterin dehydratase [Pelomicrobium sp.]|jgi:pterin-4a-carbinolamine dehydratase|uniref:4a-hydroxytetrahydrobiopterin dehydratase n=1 Tax=Pelomicrobium sp. TaxID=2815319 RepID=UPI002FDD1865